MPLQKNRLGVAMGGFAMAVASVRQNSPQERAPSLCPRRSRPQACREGALALPAGGVCPRPGRRQEYGGEDQRVTVLGPGNVAENLAILALYQAGNGKRAVAGALHISPGAVRKALAADSTQVPVLDRQEKAEPHHGELAELVVRCEGKPGTRARGARAQGALISYFALSACCRRHGIEHEPPEPAGQYDHQPGEEMQHDTSPHFADIGGREHPVPIARLALAYSRQAFPQVATTSLLVPFTT